MASRRLGVDWDMDFDEGPVYAPGPGDALFTATQRRVLALLYDGRGAAYSIRQLIGISQGGSGAVQREVAKLAACGLLTVDRVGKQKRYRANPEAPVHDELRSIVRKTAGIATPLRAALAPLADRLVLAVAWEDGCDVDLLLAGDLRYGEVYEVLGPLTDSLRRRIDPTIVTPHALMVGGLRGDPATRRLRKEPGICLVGAYTALARLLA